MRSATRNTESDVPSSSTCRRRPLQKGVLSAGKLTATGITVDEKQLISWARTNRQKNKKRPTCQVSLLLLLKLKQQVARNENDARFAAADRNRVASDRVASHISMRAWIAAQSLGQQVKISFPSLNFYLSTSLRPLAIAIDDATGHARSGGKKVSDAKSEKSVRSALQNTVGRVSRSRDLFLFGLSEKFFKTRWIPLVLPSPVILGEKNFTIENYWLVRNFV